MISEIRETFTTGALAEQMMEQYGEPLVEELRDGLRQAPLSHRIDTESYISSPEWQYAVQGEAYFQNLTEAPEYPDYQRVITYGRFGGTEEAKLRPVLYVPGFTENMVGKVATGLEFANQGKNVILPGYDSSAVMVNPDTGKKDATYTRALDLLAIISNEGLTETTLDVATHSYGALLFGAMQKIAKQRGWKCFDEAEVALLAPAGIKEREYTLGYLKRFLQSQLGEPSRKNYKDFPDTKDKAMEKASVDSMKANPMRTLREVWELKTRKTDLRAILQRDVKHLTIFGFSEDRLFPHKVLKRRIERTMQAKGPIAYASPVSYQKTADGKHIRISGATHNDDSFSPKRVVSAVLQDWSDRAA